MKGISTITMLLALFSISGFSQNSVKNPGTNDPAARKILDGVTAKLKMPQEKFRVLKKVQPI